MAVVLIAGIFIGNNMKGSYTDVTHTRYSLPTNKLNMILDLIELDYVDSVSKHDLMEEAIPMLLESLDPHSVYIPARYVKEQNESLEGNFEGIGVEFNIQNDTLLIVNTISGGPSEKVGILPGDRIITINDTLIAGIKIQNRDVIKKLKGPKGTKVRVGIKRADKKELIPFEITRDEIPLYSIDVSYMIEGKTGYIKMSNFARTTYKEFVEAVEKLESQGLENLVVDLRENTGGYLEVAYKIIDEFLNDRTLIVYTQGRARSKKNYFATSNNLCVDYGVALLIDEWSASASEIFAGAIQDNDRGLIIGRRSFGKGLVQEPRMFRDGSALRLTISRYYTPSGRCIQKPYDGGHESYRHDLSTRFLHGEFLEKDSIKLPDSLQYKTNNGRIVYGGGGIMPDIFVPRDTTGFTPYYNQISNKNLVYRYALKYTDKNRKFFNSLKNYKELIKYLDKKKIYTQFTNYAAKNGVLRSLTSSAESDYIIETQLKAYIVRNIFNDEGFYPIIKGIDKTLQKAVEVLSKEKAVSQMLRVE